MLLKVLGWSGGAMAAITVGVLIVHWNRPKVVIGGPAADVPRLALDQVDHGAFDLLLGNYVDDRGLVAYRRWKASSDDMRSLDEYLASLGAVDLHAPASRSAQLAYWINAYNALTIKGILREYPTSSIRKHTAIVGAYNMWRDLLLPIDDREYSLDDIEHDFLRGQLREPRIHFALVCAAKGCPPLRNRAFNATDLDDQLADNALRFFAQPTSFRADAGQRTIYISELFDWYGGDFAATPVEQIRLLRPYFPAKDTLSWIDEPNLTIKYLDYDWALNDQEPPP
jgi:hypothetical protein